ncbi:MAG: agmatinase [Candidatus Micrarchaeota archaeon]
MQKDFPGTRFLPPYNFPGVDPIDYAQAKVVVIPAPFDGTTSWKTGARHGPEAIISASRWLETYDEELGRDFTEEGFHTLPELEPDYGSVENTVAAVETVAGKILGDGKFPLLLGGEHALSVGAFRALKSKRPDASVLYFDAHPDLRDEFEGTRFGHACAARRGLDLGLRIAQVGIRSVSAEDKDVYDKHPGQIRPFYAFDKANWDAGEISGSLSDDVYVSFDVDAFDSSLMPATGTPEPGGLFWDEVLVILREVAKSHKIVGADVMELSPRPSLHACDFLAAKLAYKLAGFALARPRGRPPGVGFINSPPLRIASSCRLGRKVVYPEKCSSTSEPQKKSSRRRARPSLS